MKALVTGSSGFVGRHFVEFLKELDWNVYGLDIADDPDEDAFAYFVDQVDEYYDLVVHCAYEVGGRAHIDGTNMALAHNVAMDAAMFDWALKTYQGAVLYFSSSAAYPVDWQTAETHMSLRESLIDLDMPEVPDSNYGWAKLTGEKVAKQFAENGGRVHVVRPFSGYGRDQSLAYPFPSIIKRAMAGDLTVWGPPGQTRDWIHIDDVVMGAFAIYEADERRPVNLCTGIATDMEELVMTIQEVLTGDGECEVKYLIDKPTGVFYRVGDPTRMNEYYTATISIEEGVREAIGKTT
jgi:nucleoside-diphosphate-sugar epimerase